MVPLVFVPGLLCDWRLWRHQIEGLRGRLDTVVADVTRGQTVTEIAAAVLEGLPARFSLAGFSFGSQVALEMVRLSKERVDRLALLSATRGGLPPCVAVAIRQAVERLEHGEFDQYLEAAYPAYFAESSNDDPRIRRCFLDMAHAIGRGAGLRQMRALLDIRAPFGSLAEVRCPTLILGGRYDRRTTPAEHAALAAEIPGADLVIVDRAAHFAPLEQPEAVTDALRRWLIAPSSPVPSK